MPVSRQRDQASLAKQGCSGQSANRNLSLLKAELLMLCLLTILVPNTGIHRCGQHLGPTAESTVALPIVDEKAYIGWTQVLNQQIELVINERLHESSEVIDATSRRVCANVFSTKRLQSDNPRRCVLCWQGQRANQETFVFS